MLLAHEPLFYMKNSLNDLVLSNRNFLYFHFNANLQKQNNVYTFIEQLQYFCFKASFIFEMNKIRKYIIAFML